MSCTFTCYFFYFQHLRRATLTLFLSGLHTEAIVNTMHVLLVYLHSSPPEERAQAAVLLLHFDLMVLIRILILFYIVQLRFSSKTA